MMPQHFEIAEDDEQVEEDATCVRMTLAEWHTLVRMPGGVCLENWTAIRGLDIEGNILPFVES